MTKIAITGAAGTVGRLLADQLRADYDLRLSDVRPLPEGGQDEFVVADLSDLDQAVAALDGADAVIHLGGISTEAPFEDILGPNIIGTRNVFEASRRLGIGRVVFPSSNQAIGFYLKNHPIGTDVTVRPSGWYGISKAFGEAVASYYADKFGLRVLVIRIGRHAEKPEDVRGLSLWISPRDLVQLVRIGLEHPGIHFDIVYGVSDNLRSYFRNDRAEELGYRPVDRAEDHVEHAYAHETDRPPIGSVGDRYIGGRLPARDYRGDPNRSGR